jgi:glycosyltransferase involved in cell wall biosynthesis
VPCSQVLRDCAQQHAEWLALIERPRNGGKGAAVIDGFKQAIALGYSHAIQIDADGQHDVADIPRMLQLSQNQPTAMILGKPQYTADAPKSRVYGRQFTNLWICINTLSLAIADGMCGLRVYPLAAVAELLASNSLAQGMAFDIDIAVRLYWLGTPAINHPTQVSYPLDGVSHFDMWRDNLQISKTHARLFFGMLPRIPKLLFRHFR